MSYPIPRVLVSLLLFSLLGYALALPVRRAESATALEIPDLLKGALESPLSTTNRLRVPSNAGDLGLNLPAGIKLKPTQIASIGKLEQAAPQLVPKVVDIVESLTTTVTGSILPNINTILDRLLDGILQTGVHKNDKLIGSTLNAATDALGGIQSLLSSTNTVAGKDLLPVGNTLSGIL